MNKEYKFKGFDYWELVECFWDDLKHDDVSEQFKGLHIMDATEREAVMVERLCEFLKSRASYYVLENNYERLVDKEAVGKVREFIDALDRMCKRHDFNDRYIIEGLKKTKDDATFINFTTDLIWRLWN